MDLDLREAFDQGFGPEPAHRPVSERVEAGHHAVRRRRWPARSSPSPSRRSWASARRPARTGVRGALSSRPTTSIPAPHRPRSPGAVTSWSATPRRRIEVRTASRCWSGSKSPCRRTSPSARSPSPSSTTGGRAGTCWSGRAPVARPRAPRGARRRFATLESWVADPSLNTPEQWQDRNDYVTFADAAGWSLRQGVQILEQRHPVQPENFREAGDRRPPPCSEPDGPTVYVLVRDAYGEIDVDEWSTPDGGPDLDAFLVVAKAASRAGKEGGERLLSGRRLRRLRVGEADPPAPGGVRADRRLAPRRGPPADRVREAVRRVAAAARPERRRGLRAAHPRPRHVDESRRPWRRERTSLDGHDEAAPAGPSYEERSPWSTPSSSCRRCSGRSWCCATWSTCRSETAAELGISEGTVKSHTSRGMEALQDSAGGPGTDNGSVGRTVVCFTMNTLQADLDAAIPDAPLLPEVDGTLWRVGRGLASP